MPIVLVSTCIQLTQHHRFIISNNNPFIVSECKKKTPVCFSIMWRGKECVPFLERDIQINNLYFLYSQTGDLKLCMTITATRVFTGSE